jgi:glutaminyl-peptide cyclotransferase
MKRQPLPRRAVAGFPAALLSLAFTMGAVSGSAVARRQARREGRLALPAKRSPSERIPVLRATVVRIFPHDPHAFTQGLEYYGGYLYESTGIVGKSMLRKVELSSGRVIQQVSLLAPYFGEGLTIFRGKIYQLTWLSETGFIYDLNSFRQVGRFQYQGEGWGLTHDDTSLILSDGTNKLRYLDPRSFKIMRTLEVYAGHEAVTHLNELEYIGQEIFANVWHSPRIARIDPRSGQVDAWIDLSEIAVKEQPEQEGVLNGIAYDQNRKRIFVTGKLWSHIIEIKLD